MTFKDFYRFVIFVGLITLMTVHSSCVNIRITESRGISHFLLFFDRCSLRIHRKLNSSQYVKITLSETVFASQSMNSGAKISKMLKSGFLSGAEAKLPI